MPRVERPRFGQAPAGVRPVPRPSAYAVVPGEDGRIAVVRTTKGWMLPGGGIDAGESAAEAVTREAREECGITLLPGDPLGEADEIVFARDEDTWFDKQGVFLVARLARGATGDHEPDHELTWLDPAAAAGALTHESHRWAVERWLEQNAEGPAG